MTCLTLQTAGFGYGGAPVLAPLSLSLEGASLIALAGPNGAGKSTLLKLAAGLEHPGEGTVALDGTSLASLSARERARQLAYLPPDGRAAWPVSVRTVVELGRAPYLKPLRTLAEADAAAVDRAMARTGVTELAGRRFDTLSSGERARALIARALAVEAPVLVLDEPTAALDLRHQLSIMDILRSEAERGVVVLVAIHALELAAAAADRVLLLENGTIRADGPPSDALCEENVRAIFGVAAPGGISAHPYSPL